MKKIATNPPPTIALVAKRITKTFEERPSKSLLALKDINLEIQRGEIFVLLGPSGSGKSTLLRIMSGLEKSYNGSVVFGSGIKKEDISFVFQQFALLPWLTVYQNVELNLLSRHLKEDERRAAICLELKKFGLEKFAHVYPKELSGGMRQRVGLARAMVSKPKIIFMDEPFSELDSFMARQLRQELLDIWKTTSTTNARLTIIIVTHLIEEALLLADRIAVLTPRPGHIEKLIINHLPRPREIRSPDFFKLEDELYQLIKP